MTDLRRRLTGRLVDVAAIAGAVFVALSLGGEAELSGRIVGDRMAVLVMLACAGSLLLWWRRRAPVVVAVLLVPIAAVTDFATGAVLIAVYTVAKYHRWRAIATVVVLHALAGIASAALHPDPSLGIVLSVAIGAGLLAIPVAVGVAVRSRLELIESLRERAVRAEAEAGLRAEQLRALERERIAREMHDVLAHRISLVSLHAGALEIRPDLSTEEVAAAAATIRASAHQALEDLREILGVLRGGTGLGPPRSLADLEELLAECRAAGGEVVVDEPPPPLDGLSASASRTAYRVVQEGLTNARKHAEGAAVHVLLVRTSGQLHVQVRNPLSWTAGIPGARSGLEGLAERVALAGGRLEHGARRGRGGGVEFHLEAWLPWGK